MGEKKELSFDDFKDVTDCIYMAVDKLDTLFKSLELSDKHKSELSRLGGLLHATSHEVGHFFTDLESLPDEIKEKLHDYFGH